MPANPNQLWIIVNFDGQVIHHTTDPAHVELMQRYVLKSREAGDDWRLLQYAFDKVVHCELNQMAS